MKIIYCHHAERDVDDRKLRNQNDDITENGAKVLRWMRDNEIQFSNIFKAKEIAEGLFTTSRSVSGSMRKLVNDNFIYKIVPRGTKTNQQS